VSIFEAHPEVGLVAGAACYWDSWRGGKDHTVLVGHVQNKVVEPPGALLSLYPLGKAPSPCPSCLIVRRSVVESVGGFENSFIGPLQMYEDQAFLTKVYLHTPVYFSGVRRHFLAWFARHLADVGFTDWKVWRKLRIANWPYRHPRLHGTLRNIYSTIRRVWRGMKRPWSEPRRLTLH
jgi:hypothetical protein